MSEFKNIWKNKSISIKTERNIVVTFELGFKTLHSQLRMIITLSPGHCMQNLKRNLLNIIIGIQL